MKLSKVTNNDPLQRLALSIHGSTVDDLKRYQCHYTAVHGDDISMSQLTEAILRQFMQADREFQNAPRPTAPNSPAVGSTGS